MTWRPLTPPQSRKNLGQPGPGLAASHASCGAFMHPAALQATSLATGVNFEGVPSAHESTGTPHAPRSVQGPPARADLGRYGNEHEGIGTPRASLPVAGSPTGANFGACCNEHESPGNSQSSRPFQHASLGRGQDQSQPNFHRQHESGDPLRPSGTNPAATRLRNNIAEGCTMQQQGSQSGGSKPHHASGPPQAANADVGLTSRRQPMQHAEANPLCTSSPSGATSPYQQVSPQQDRSHDGVSDGPKQQLPAQQHLRHKDLPQSHVIRHVEYGQRESDSRLGDGHDPAKEHPERQRMFAVKRSA